MAGIGVRLNRIYGKNTIVSSLVGFAYSAVISVLPMLIIIINLMLMQQLLGFDKVSYAYRELFSSTILYIFMFSLLAAAPFNAVLSRYMSDVIYKEQYGDIMSCYYVGLFLNVALGCVMGIPFCIHEHIVGRVDLTFVFGTFVGFIALILVFYTMTFLSICKDYKKISLFFTVGMVTAFVVAALLIEVFQRTVIYSMLAALDVGFLLTACLEMAVVRSYFRENSGHYRDVLGYFKTYWQLVVINFFYTLGLYVHNFVFWTTEYRMVVANSFVSMQAYDMATCIAMFTNITSTAIFTSRIEMHFHERYKAYSEAVIGGRRMDIESARERMFSQLSQELMNLTRIQFIISVIIFLLCCVFLPQLGFGGMVMRIYPCLAAGYFILFIVYSAILFLYYFNDLEGALYTTAAFTFVIFLGSVVATRLPQIWYGIGLTAGAFVGWVVAYFRLRWVEKNLDVHVFCQGSILKAGKGERPSSRVFSRYEDEKGTTGQEKDKDELTKREKPDKKPDQKPDKKTYQKPDKKPGRGRKTEKNKRSGSVKEPEDVIDLDKE